MSDKTEQYVRLFSSPKCGIGIIMETKIEYGQTQHLFHQDERFTLKIHDFWADEGDFEPCDRPTDEYVKAINAVAKRGS